MFSIIISEKGGAERRESFDKNEINVGRVQGNDLMLPKGNVSKHHARLLFRDGRFIVTDLKSTNGTYVNGRKIAQATIVREGDKIYIGDFVIRLATQGTGTAEPAPVEDESIRTVQRDQAAAARPGPGPGPGPAMTLKAQQSQPNQPQVQRPPEKFQIDDIEDSEPLQKGRPPAMTPAAPEPTPPPQAAAKPPMGTPMSPMDGSPGVSPMGNSSAPMPIISASRPAAPGGRVVQATMPLQPVPGAMRPVAPIAPSPLPQGAIATPQPMQAPVVDRMIAPAAPERPPQAPQASPPMVDRVIAPAAPERPFSPPPAVADRVIAPPVADRVKAPPVAARPLGQSSPPPPLQPPPADVRAPLAVSPIAPPRKAPPREAAPVPGRQTAMAALSRRVADAVDLASHVDGAPVSESLAQAIERASRSQGEALRSEGQIPDGVDFDALVLDVQKELVHAGALASLLDDDDVSEIHYARFDRATVVRGGAARAEDCGFSSEEALVRIIGRLAAESGEPRRPGETVLERWHPKASIVAVVQRAGSVLSVRKRTRVEGTLEEMSRAQAIGRQMATFLEACVAGRVNILSAGPGSVGVVVALASAVAPGERVAVVSDVEDVVLPNGHVTSIAMVDQRARGEEAVRAAARLAADRLVVTRLSGMPAAALAEVVADGASGVLAASQAPNLRQATARLAAQLVLARPGITIDSAREAISETFDIAVECARGADGRERIQRIAEVVGTDPKGVVLKDIFTCDETGFTATGIVPKVVGELAQRGVKVDGGLFKRR